MTETAIVNARIFDGERVLRETTVVVDGGRITAVGGDVPARCQVIDAAGGTLLPGLFDAHAHTSEQALAHALRFGVTTELEMQGLQTGDNQARVSENDSLADVRSAGFGITPPGGHPSELFPEDARPGENGEEIDDEGTERQNVVQPFSTTPREAESFVPELVAAGSDYIKFMVDDGTVEGHPGLPMLDQATLNAGVAEAHRHGMLTVAHTLTADATRMAVEAGVDGLAHLFMDRPHDDEIIELIARSGAFVVPCAVLDASMMGITGADLAADPRVASRLDEAWLTTLRGSFDRFPQGRLDDVLASVEALRAAGVDILAGTDASVPAPFLGGVAHGASVHHELRYLVEAGLPPVEALRAATRTPARRFGLDDRGRIATGLRADLLLVDGDPTVDISDTLNIRAVWRRGVRLAVDVELPHLCFVERILRGRRAGVVETASVVAGVALPPYVPAQTLDAVNSADDISAVNISTYVRYIELQELVMSEHRISRRTFISSSATPAAAERVTLRVDTTKPGHAVSPDLYGEFFEEINYAGDGGLYGELIRNRAFMDPSTPGHWQPGVERVGGRFGGAVRLNGPTRNGYVRLPQGIVSELTDFTVATWVKPASVDTRARVFDFGDGPPVNMFLTVSAGSPPRYAVTKGGNGNEQRLDAPSSLPTDRWTHLAITLSGTTVTLYVAGEPVDTNTGMTLNPSSLGATPNNWVGRSQYSADPLLNAARVFRPDLVDLLKAPDPRFLRFPGGDYLEGSTLDDHWAWKETIGPISRRPGHPNSAWGYWSDDGLGLLEYLELSEVLGATPVMGIWAGYALNGTHVPREEFGRVVQDALDQIEFTIGTKSSKWGARRAEYGHPQPFDLTYVEIGNESYFDPTGSYEWRYAALYDAIKKRYPNLAVIASAKVENRPMDVLDEHYYSDPQFFVPRRPAAESTTRRHSTAGPARST